MSKSAGRTSNSPHAARGGNQTDSRRAVLVVDDDPEIRLVLREVLTEEGYRVEEARDGGECLRHLAGARARLVVLLDLMMPGVDGFEVCHRLAKNPSSRNGHAIVLMSARRRLERADCSVADATLAKPFDLDALLSTVDQLSTRLAG